MVGQQTITVPLSHDETSGDTHVVGSGTLTLHRVR
jgi:hypothetical protein